MTDRGADLAVVGTGDLRHAKSFAEDEDVPFPVLVDDQGEAATAAAVRSVGFLELFHPQSWAATRRAWREGYRLYRPGKRTTQLGATFVLGPGATLRYEHYDKHPADHAPMEEILAALG